MSRAEMESGLPIDPEQLIAVVSAVGGLGLLGALGYLFARRARAARLRQIEEIGTEPLPAQREKRRRPVLEPEPEEDEEEESKADAAEQEEQAAEHGAAAGERPQEAAEAEEVEDAPARAAAPAARAQPAPAQARDADVIPFPRPAAPVDKPRPVEPAPQAEPAEHTKKRDAAALAPGLARTRSGWVARLGALFAGKKQIDPAVLDEIEKVLLTADIGVKTSQKLLGEMRASLSRQELTDSAAIWAFLRRRTLEILSFDTTAVKWDQARPFVLLIIGVNGSGKTTTIGKLAAKLMADGKKVVLGAGDTFRAAAVEQLAVWADRVKAPIVRGKEGADPSSVLFDAVKRASTDGHDVVIADTAGRLHTKVDLMEELQKVRRVIGKAAPGAPHETWLVIDSTSGQNAIAQAQIFTKAMAVSGIVLTKLDGTAKGGVILGIADELQIPVRYVGIGERVEDLRPFDAEEFVEALYTDVV
jgi:fused signal recognition particle receptor